MTNSYLVQRRTLSRNIANLHAPQRLYIPGSETLINAIDPVLLADRPENIELLLPSALPPASRNTQCVDGLPELEFRLRCAQAADALHDIRSFRRLTRILSVKTQSHISNTQRTGTRTRSLFDNVNVKLAQAVSTYRTSRAAIANLAPNEEFGPWMKALQVLRNEDIRGPGSDESKPKPGASRFVQSWIWTTAPLTSTSTEDPDLQAALRVEWAKAQERAKRHEEEVELVVEEMRRTLVTFELKSQEWASFVTSPPLGDSAIDSVTMVGIAAYANKQADIRRRMVTTFVNDWYHLLEKLPSKVEWLEKYPRPPEIKRRRLVSNVKLYHPDSYDPQTDPLDDDADADADAN